MIKKIILILLLLSQFKSKSQIDEFDNDSVLPLEVVHEHAINHSPLLNMYESYCTKSKAEMDIQKYAWMKDVTLSVDTKYGQYGNLQPMDQLSLITQINLLFSLSFCVRLKFGGWSTLKFQPTQSTTALKLDVSGIVPGAILSLQMLLEVMGGITELLEVWRNQRTKKSSDVR